MEQPTTPVAADNQTTETDLEKLTNETYGQEGIPQLGESAGKSPDEVVPDVEPAPPDETPAAPTDPKGGQVSEEEQSLLNELRALKEMSGTPFKTPLDLVKSYKDLQSQWTKDHEFVTKVKPFEQLLGDMSDPNFANFIQQSAVLYKNPHLASAYVNPQGQMNTPPDPRSYNMFEDTDKARYDKDLSDYFSRTIDSRMNARFASSEQQTKLDKMRGELKAAFPDSNSPELEKWVSSRANDWSLIDAYKIREFDNLKSKSMEEARKELTHKLETASRTTTPTPTASAKGSFKVEDIIEFIGRYGGDAAKKKFGDKPYSDALRQSMD